MDSESTPTFAFVNSHLESLSVEQQKERSDGNCRELWLEPVNPGEDLFSDNEWQAIAEGLGLSERQRQVIERLLEGYTREEMATEFDCSVETIRLQLTRLFRQLRVAGRVGLILRIVRAYLHLQKGQSKSVDCCAPANKSFCPTDIFCTGQGTDKSICGGKS